MIATLPLTSAAFHMRDPRTRLLFRYGVVTLTHVPLLVAMETAP